MSAEFRIRPKSGVIRWVYLKAVPMFSDESGNAGYVGTVLDITERRGAEESIREMALFAQLNSAPVVRFDATCQVLSANSAAS